MGTSGYLGDLDLNWSNSEFSCTGCGEAIEYMEEVFVVTVVLAQLTERGVVYSPVLYEDGDFLYEPHFLCFSCREGYQEELKELVRDMPPVLDDYSVINCKECLSGIRTGEVVAMITHGEIRLSKRSPNGISGGSTFECMDDDPDVLCVSCINKMSRDIVDCLWKEDVQQFRECPEGTEIRCWRSGCSADEDSDCANCKRQVG